MNETLKINIDNYSGPLEVLLDLAKSQKVDLNEISITQLADQFIQFINDAKQINLDLASDFKATEVAEKLKIQLKKLELIRLLSDQLLKKNRLGYDVRMRGVKGDIRLNKNSKYVVTLYELLKSYSSYVMKKNFLTINIPKLPVCTLSLKHI